MVGSIICAVIGLIMLFMTAGVADGFGLVLGIPLALGCGWFAWMGFSTVTKHDEVTELIQQDAKNKKKIVVEGPVIRKREEHYKYGVSYYLEIADEEYIVVVSQYTRCDEGDTVRLHLSEKAKLPLDLEKHITQCIY